MHAQQQLFEHNGQPTINGMGVESWRERVFLLARAHRDIPGRFIGWLEDNWEIWWQFCLLADKMRHTGRKYYSARAVMHVLRWHRALSEKGNDGFKINNNNSAAMARLYNEVHGLEFFRTRDNG